jgi:hypothetical protein
MPKNLDILKLEKDNIDHYFKAMNRCNRCILPETFPGISFDSDGVCNYCHSYSPMTVSGETKFQEVLSQYRDKGEKYDCIVAFSGGRDSSFVLHQIIRKYQMRTLALTVDSGFITNEGYRNIDKVTSVLGVDHVWLKNDEKIETAKKNGVIKFQGWLKNPSINTIVPVLNAGDKTMNLQMYRYAKDYGIPLVIGGNIIGNASIEQEHFKTGYMGVFPNERGEYSVFDKWRLVYHFGIEYFRNPYNFRFPILNEYVTGYLVYMFESFLKPKNVDSLGFYDYIYWKEDEILSTITQELNWEGAADTSTTWRIDDSAYPLINYLYLRLVGFTEHDEMYSKMIREGQITQSDAMKRCESDHTPRLPSLTRLFDELQVTREQVDSAIDKYRIVLLPKILKNLYQRVIVE